VLSTLRLKIFTVVNIIKKLIIPKVKIRVEKSIFSIEIIYEVGYIYFMIRAVFFDFGGTILDNVTFLEKYATKADQKILKSLGYSFSLGKIEKARFKAMEYIENRFKGNSKKHTVGLYNFYFFKFLGIKPSMNLAMKFYRKLSCEWDKYKKNMPYAKELLQFLKRKGIKIVLVSNGSVKGINHDLQLSKMRKYFDLVVISEKLGREKSTLVPFKYALKKLELKPQEVLVVGDRIDEEIFAGKKLGCTTVRIDFGFWKNYRKDEYEEADYVIKSLKEIKSLL